MDPYELATRQLRKTAESVKNDFPETAQHYNRAADRIENDREQGWTIVRTARRAIYATVAASTIATICILVSARLDWLGGAGSRFRALLVGMGIAFLFMALWLSLISTLLLPPRKDPENTTND